MPTPFTHLRIVVPFIQMPDQWFLPAAAEILSRCAGPFLLGSISPDVRTITLLSRQETHFYPIPPDPHLPSTRALLQTWPSLSDPMGMPAEQAAFIAGYLAHLWFDEFWHQRIITPYYVERDDWGSHRARFNIYNILLGYLDARDKAALGEKIGLILRTAEPAGWSPFVSDADLIAWRDFLMEQFQPGTESYTAAILAQRADMLPADLSALIADEEQMEHKVFVRTPRRVIDRACQDGITGSARIIQSYLCSGGNSK